MQDPLIIKEKFDQLLKLQKEIQSLMPELDKHVLKICNWHRALLKNLEKYDENVELYNPDEVFIDVEWTIHNGNVECVSGWYRGGGEYDTTVHFFSEDLLYSEEVRNTFEKDVLNKIADFRDKEAKRRIQEESETQQQEIETMNYLMKKYKRN